MRKSIILIMSSLFLSISLYGQDIKLEVSEDKIIIPIGTDLIISVELNDSKIENFKLLNQSEIPELIDMMKEFDKIEKKDTVSNEIEFKFNYADFMGSKIVMLNTVHHLEEAIIFKAKIKIKGYKKYVETSIVNIYPNIPSIEQWQDDIESIILYDFEIVKEKN